VTSPQGDRNPEHAEQQEWIRRADRPAQPESRDRDRCRAERQHGKRGAVQQQDERPRRAHGGDRAQTHRHADPVGDAGAAELVRNTTRTDAIVSATASAHGAARRAANRAPEMCSCASTIRFVRFDPGRRSDAEFAMNTAP
jgi:hypothetical protein